MAPQSRAIPVLITRPEPQASRTASDLCARFGARVAPILTPLLAVSFRDDPLPSGPFDSMILTSETGVAAARRLIALGKILPARAYCVGDRTAEAAQAAGFQALSANGDANDLVSLILSHAPSGRQIHLRGRDTRGSIAETLTEHGRDVVDHVGYQQDPHDLTAEAIHCLEGTDSVAIPLFSPRTAQLFRAALAKSTVRAPITLFALSPAIAAELAGIPADGLHVAERPTWAHLADTMSQVLFGA